MPAQLLAAPRDSHALFGHVSSPNSPGWGMDEGPPELAAADIVSPDVAWGRRQGFTDAAAHDHQILVDNSGRSQSDALRLRIAAKILPQLDLSAGPEGLDRFAVRWIERVNEIADRRKDSPLASFRPGTSMRGLVRFRGSPESNVHRGAPVAALIAKALWCVGV